MSLPAPQPRTSTRQMLLGKEGPSLALGACAEIKGMMPVMSPSRSTEHYQGSPVSPYCHLEQ